jgi:hypothetical protein
MAIPRPEKPADYRKKEMEILAEWILAGESGSVVGLAGCGRSNLLDFLCHRPEVLATYLPDEAGPVVLIPIDLNDLPANDSSTLYRLILRSFYWERKRFAQHLADTITRLYQENRTSPDPFVSQSALYEVLFAFKHQQNQVVLILNRFDRFCQRTTPEMLNTLRSLRDRFKDTLCFIGGMRQEVAYLPESSALGDMYELLDSNCWVGAMSDSDAEYVIKKATRTAKTPPTEEEYQKMLALTGNFPALLKPIGNWWLRTQLPINEWPTATALAIQHRFEYRLARLWSGLTQEEQFALSAVQRWQVEAAKEKKKQSTLEKELAKLNEDHSAVLKRLVDKGVCDQTGAEWQIRGELLAAYISRVGPYSRGGIRLDAKTETIYQGMTELKDLPPLEYNLLRFLIDHPYKPHPYSKLMNTIWAEDRTRNELFLLVRSLRQKIELTLSEPRYLVNRKGNPEGFYQFYPEGRPE